MKKAAVLPLLACMVAAPSFAVSLPEGTQEFGLQGSLDLDYEDDYLFVLDTSYGYFVMEDWEIGGDLDVTMSDSNKRFQLGVFTEYNFTNESDWVPFVGLSFQLANLSVDDDDSSDGVDVDLDFEDATALNVKLAGGIKYFLNKNVAITAEVNYNIATDDINISGDKVEDSFTQFVFGTRFYF